MTQFSVFRVMAHSKVLRWYGENISKHDFDTHDDEILAFDEHHQ